jgi:hypothetical protein
MHNLTIIYTPSRKELFTWGRQRSMAAAAPPSYVNAMYVFIVFFLFYEDQFLDVLHVRPKFVKEKLFYFLAKNTIVIYF